MMGLLHSRIWQLVLVVSLGCASAYGQGCEDFSLEAEASSPTAEFGKPVLIQLTLTNHSQGTVTVYTPQLPTDWSIYEKSGTRWTHLRRGGLRRSSGSESSQSDPRPSSEKFPATDYVKVAPGEVVTTKVDFNLWGPKEQPVKYNSDTIRVFFMYHVEPRDEETQLNMLRCYLQTEPVEISLITKKQAGNKKAAAAANGSQ